MVDRFGNVVAISVSGITASAEKLGTSLNFFIPIADALKFLAVEMVEQDGHSSTKQSAPEWNWNRPPR